MPRADDERSSWEITLYITDSNSSMQRSATIMKPGGIRPSFVAAGCGAGLLWLSVFAAVAAPDGVPEENRQEPAPETAAPARDADFGDEGDQPGQDADFGGGEDKPPQDADFGGGEDKPAQDADFGDGESKPSRDADFGDGNSDPRMDALFGDDSAEEEDEAPGEDSGLLELLKQAQEASEQKKAEEGEDEEAEDIVYASAAEAHTTFLEALETEKRFPSAATCSKCHPDHYREWSVSAHAYAQMSPVFNTMHAAIVDRTAGTNGDFCIRCHTQVGMQRDEPLFTSNLKRHPASLEGITCVVCHRVDKDYGKVSGRTHINRGDIFEPVYGPEGNAILKEALASEDFSNLKTDPDPEVKGTAVHAEVVEFDPIAKSGFCGTCHDVNLYNGFRLEEAFTQFKNSPASHEKQQSCQDCHMGRVPGAVVPGADKVADPEGFDLANYLRGPGARVGGKVWAEPGDEKSEYGTATRTRKRTNHMFAGPDYSIVHPALFPHSQELRQRMWDVKPREIPGTGKHERVGMEHLLEFRWEEGWGDPGSYFEKRVAEDPDRDDHLPWPWDRAKVRKELRAELNKSFRLLNEIDKERHQILRRAIRFGDFEVTRNDRRGIEFALEIRNHTDGHGVPTGFDAERLMILQTTVRDRLGRTVFVSGDRDPNGDVRDLHSSFVHHHAKKVGPWLEASAWKREAGMPLLEEDLEWTLDKQLFSLQSKFITRNHRGGEREQILAVNYSVDPLPYIRPDTRPGILYGRPAAARKQARIIPPLGAKWARYSISPDHLTGMGPYTVQFKFICQMVPVNLVKEISDQGFDYNLSPREVGKRVVHGHPTDSSGSDAARRGGALTIWEKTLTLPDAPHSANFAPSEADIMRAPRSPFPYLDPDVFSAGSGGAGTADDAPYPKPDKLPESPGRGIDRENPLLPGPEEDGEKPAEDADFDAPSQSGDDAGSGTPEESAMPEKDAEFEAPKEDAVFE